MKNCPNCGSSQMVYETRDLEISYKGRSTVAQGIEGQFCMDCGEGILDRFNGDKYGTAIREFRNSVNSDFVEGSWIAGVRKKLDLDQKTAASIFGGGASAFSRYERGTAKPPKSLVQLFKILEKHPEMLRELDQA